MYKDGLFYQPKTKTQLQKPIWYHESTQGRGIERKSRKPLSLLQEEAVSLVNRWNELKPGSREESGYEEDVLPVHGQLKREGAACVCLRLATST